VEAISWIVCQDGPTEKTRRKARKGNDFPKYQTNSSELKRALRRSKRAAAAFAKLAPSHRREYIGWVRSARKKVIRATRARKVLKMLRKKMP
jgi:uncharacterized protein YdeI (YjbR/CyaY-like superfamily)